MISYSRPGSNVRGRVRDGDLVTSCLLPGNGATRLGKGGRIQCGFIALKAMDDKVQYKDRKRAAKRATKLEWSPRTMDVMARVLMVGGKKTSAQEAEHWALRAIRREPDNPDYRATYAELLWIWDRREDSYTQAKRAIELDSNHARSLYCASQFLMWQIQFFMD